VRSSGEYWIKSSAGKFLQPGRGPENGFTGGGIGLVAVFEEGELVNILGRLLVGGRNFASALIEVAPLFGGILSEDKLPPSDGLALASTCGGRRLCCRGRGAQFPRGVWHQPRSGAVLGRGDGEGRRFRRDRGQGVRALEAKKGVMSSHVYNSKRLPFLPFLGYPSSPREESAVWFCFVPHLSPQDLDLLLWPDFERLYK
jgi:hypothetical protein